MGKINRHLKTNSQITERFLHPDKYSVGFSNEYLAGWLEPIEEEIIRLILRHTIFLSF